MAINVPEYALYLRKSIGRAGIRRQRTVTTAHIERLGGKVIAEFSDADRTAYRKPGAARPEREDFDRMLTYLAAHPGTGIAAWHADRLARDPEDQVTLSAACVKGGHPIETPSGGLYDLSTATGRKRFRDDISTATYEVDHGRERCLAAKLEAVDEGKDLGGRRRFGWDRVPTGERGDKGQMITKLVLIPAEADLIRQGIKYVLETRDPTLAEIARSWNAAGVHTSTGREWKPTEVRRTLLRARNAGLLEHHGEIVGKGDWDAIVTETQWRAVRAVLSGPDRRTTPGPDRKWLCSGVALCGICGAPLLSSTAGSSRGSRAVYRCRRAGLHVARDARSLDAYVTGLALSRLSRDDVVLTPQTADTAALEAERAAIRGELDELAELAGQRAITPRQMALSSKPLQGRLGELEQQISAAARPGALAPFAGADDPVEVWGRLTPGQRRGVIETLMCVTVFPAPKGRTAGWRPGQPYFDPESVHIMPRAGLGE